MNHDHDAGPPRVAISGSIASGKSTLTAALARRLGWRAILETPEDNPYLAAFYEDMRRWGFHSQLHFLSRRLEQHVQLIRSPAAALLDRTAYEDAEVFAYGLFRAGYIAATDWQVYSRLYTVALEILPPPDLMVYLHARVPTLLERITARGHEYERMLSAEYLERVGELYDQWVQRFALCPIVAVDTDEVDLLSDASLDHIADQIRMKQRVGPAPPR